MAPRSLTAILLVCVLAGHLVDARRPCNKHKLYGMSGNCNTCLTAVRVLDDLLCDPSVDETVINIFDKYVCPSSGDKDQCMQWAVALTPVALDWLRTTASPATLCGDIGVCGTAVLGDPALAQVHKASNGVECALCSYLVDQVKAFFKDTIAEKDVREKLLQACSKLPAQMQPECVTYVNTYEPMIFALITNVTSSDICMVMGACMADLAHVKPPQLPAIIISSIAASSDRLQLAREANTEECDICKIAVSEARSFLADPKFQAQLEDYAKQICGSLESLKDQCVAYVEQYAPLAFGIALTYLQPDYLCGELGLCKPAVAFVSAIKY